MYRTSLPPSARESTRAESCPMILRRRSRYCNYIPLLLLNYVIFFSDSSPAHLQTRSRQVRFGKTPRTPGVWCEFYSRTILKQAMERVLGKTRCRKTWFCEIRNCNIWRCFRLFEILMVRIIPALDRALQRISEKIIIEYLVKWNSMIKIFKNFAPK